MRWKKHFSNKIWQRGYYYYADNVIKSISYGGGEVNAVVSGTKDYQVIIKFNSDLSLKEMSCNCPYWDNCKHEAAVLRSLNDMDEVELSRSIFGLTFQEYAGLVDVIDEDGDGSEQKYANKLDAESKTLLNKMTKLRPGADQGEVAHLYEELTDKIQKIVTLGKLVPDLTVNMLIKIISFLLKIKVWPQNLSQDEALTKILKILQVNLMSTDSWAKEIVFKDIKQEITKNYLSPGVTILLSFLVDNFNGKFYLNQETALCEDLESKYQYLAAVEDVDKQLSQVAEVKLTLMLRSSSFSEMLAYAKQNICNSNIVCSVAMAASRKEVAQAISLLEAAKYRVKFGDKGQIAISQTLAILYRKNKQYDLYKQELLLLLAEYDPGNQMALAKLKQQFNLPEWNEIMTALAEKLPSNVWQNLTNREE